MNLRDEAQAKSLTFFAANCQVFVAKALFVSFVCLCFFLSNDEIEFSGLADRGQPCTLVLSQHVMRVLQFASGSHDMIRAGDCDRDVIVPEL